MAIDRVAAAYAIRCGSRGRSWPPRGHGTGRGGARACRPCGPGCRPSTAAPSCCSARSPSPRRSSAPPLGSRLPFAFALVISSASISRDKIGEECLALHLRETTRGAPRCAGCLPLTGNARMDATWSAFRAAARDGRDVSEAVDQGNAITRASLLGNPTAWLVSSRIGPSATRGVVREQLRGPGSCRQWCAQAMVQQADRCQIRTEDFTVI